MPFSKPGKISGYGWHFRPVSQKVWEFHADSTLFGGGGGGVKYEAKLFFFSFFITENLSV